MITGNNFKICSETFESTVHVLYLYTLFNKQYLYIQEVKLYCNYVMSDAAPEHEAYIMHMTFFNL